MEAGITKNVLFFTKTPDVCGRRIATPSLYWPVAGEYGKAGGGGIWKGGIWKEANSV